MDVIGRRGGAPFALALVAGLVLALPAAPAVAAPTWLPTADLQTDLDDFYTDAHVAVDGQGNATAVWFERAEGGSTVKTSTHPAGGTWSAPTSLSTQQSFPTSLDIAVDPAGNAVAVWSMRQSGHDVVEAATRVAGTWSAPVTLSDPGDSFSDVHVAVDGPGHAIAVWARQSAGVEAADWSSATGWSSTTVPGGAAAYQPEVAASASGRATVVFLDIGSSPDFFTTVRAVTRPTPATPFSGPLTASSTSTEADKPVVATGPNGATTTAWSQPRTGGGDEIRSSSLASDGASWTSPLLVSDPAATSAELDAVPRLAVDGAGTATAVWSRQVGPSIDVQTSSAAAGGSWSAPHTLGPTRDTDTQDVAVDAAGDATAVWHNEDSSPDAVGATRPAGGPWGGLVPLSSGDLVNALDVAMDPAGNAIAVWGKEIDPAGGIVQARTFDVAGPLATGLSIPPSGVATQSATFAWAAVDAWSSVTGVAWSFGDGTSGVGTSLTHTYAAAGTYAVSVTATDAVGNATTRTGSVVVSPAPVVQPPATPKPTLTAVKLTKKKIHVKGSDEKPRVTKLRLTLNTAAKVTVKLKRTQKMDGKAVKAKVTKSLATGTSAIRLTSKVGGTRLPPGKYRVTVTARNPVGRSPAVVLRLTIQP